MSKTLKSHTALRLLVLNKRNKFVVEATYSFRAIEVQLLWQQKKKTKKREEKNNMTEGNKKSHHQYNDDFKIHVMGSLLFFNFFQCYLPFFS